jgi:hypothetical protein
MLYTYVDMQLTETEDGENEELDFEA